MSVMPVPGPPKVEVVISQLDRSPQGRHTYAISRNGRVVGFCKQAKGDKGIIRWFWWMTDSMQKIASAVGEEKINGNDGYKMLAVDEVVRCANRIEVGYVARR